MKDSGAKPHSRGNTRGDDVTRSGKESRVSKPGSLLEDGVPMDPSVEPAQALRSPTPEGDADAGDALVVGAPEPADWVRLPEDPRTARTVPSVRRRRSLTPRVLVEGQLTPAAARLERRRERFQRWIAFGLGSLLAVLAVGFGLVSSRETMDAPAPAVAAAIEPARAAVPATPRGVEEADEIPPPPDLPNESPAHPDERPSAARASESPGNTPNVPGGPVGSTRAVRANEQSAASPGLVTPATRASQRNKPKNKLWFPPE